MIDIHSHILPGIDDGARDLQDSIDLAQEAVDNGITTMIATPHHQNGVYVNEKEDVLATVDYVQHELQKRDIPLEVLPGQEIHVHSDIVDRLKEDALLTLGGQSKYILLELPYDTVPRFIHQMLYDIQLAGIIPIIPHPERNHQIRHHPNLLYEMIERGALSQITAASIIGKFGEKVQEVSLQMIEHNMCHLIASDAHRAGRRGVHMQEAYTFLDKEFGKYLSRELQANAESLFNGDDLYVSPPEKVRKKRKWYDFLLKGSRK